jgi:hypothetical protein
MTREQSGLVLQEETKQSSTAGTPSRLEELLDISDSSSCGPTVLAGVLIGEIVGFTAESEPLVDFLENPHRSPLLARSITSLTANDTGKQVALQFEKGDPTKPLILGCLRGALDAVAGDENVLSAKVDDDEIIITARTRVTLRCGKASITLTRAGKVLIRGEYVLSRASGANQIQGGSVELN